MADILPDLRTAVELCLRNCLITWDEPNALQYIPVVLDDCRPPGEIADIRVTVTSPLHAEIIGIWDRPNRRMQFMVQTWRIERTPGAPPTSLHVGEPTPSTERLSGSSPNSQGRYPGTSRLSFSSSMERHAEDSEVPPIREINGVPPQVGVPVDRPPEPGYLQEPLTPPTSLVPPAAPVERPDDSSKDDCDDTGRPYRQIDL